LGKQRKEGRVCAAAHIEINPRDSANKTKSEINQANQTMFCRARRAPLRQIQM